MLRFWYVVPRLLLMLAVCLFLLFGFDPLVRYALERVGQLIVHAKVEIGDCRASPIHLSMCLRDVHIADPKHPLRDLFAFDEARLQLDSRALADRRLVVERGLITGLRFDIDRDFSGALDGPPESVAPNTDSQDGYLSALSQQATQEAERWWSSLQDRLAADLEQRLRSIPLARELTARWQNEYRALRSDVQRWKGVIQRFRQIGDKMRDDPLQQLPQLPGYYRELAELRAELEQASGNLQRLQQQLAADRQAVQAAKEHDLRQLSRLGEFEGLDPEALTDYLLGEPLQQRVQQLTGWLRRARAGFSYLAQPPKWNRQAKRGIDLLLLPNREPALLVQYLLLSGHGTAAGGAFSFAGRATDLTYQPRRHDRPAVFELSFQGSVAGQLRAVIDQRAEVAKQRFTIQCPRLVHQDYTLGRQDQWSIQVARGGAAVWVDLEFKGDQVSGDLRWREDKLQLQAAASGRRGSSIARGLQGALDEIDRLHAQVSLSGPASRPQLQVRSNLGTDLSRGLQAAAQRELSARGAQLAARLEQQVKQQMDRLTAGFTQEQRELLAVVQSNRELIAGLEQLAAGINPPQEVLGVRVPFFELFGRRSQ